MTVLTEFMTEWFLNLTCTIDFFCIEENCLDVREPQARGHELARGSSGSGHALGVRNIIKQLTRAHSHWQSPQFVLRKSAARRFVFHFRSVCHSTSIWGAPMKLNRCRCKQPLDGERALWFCNGELRGRRRERDRHLPDRLCTLWWVEQQRPNYQNELWKCKR